VVLVPLELDVALEPEVEEVVVLAELPWEEEEKAEVVVELALELALGPELIEPVEIEPVEIELEVEVEEEDEVVEEDEVNAADVVVAAPEIGMGGIPSISPPMGGVYLTGEVMFSDEFDTVIHQPTFVAFIAWYTRNEGQSSPIEITNTSEPP